MRVNVTTEPTAVSGLESGTIYVIQNQGRHIVRIASGSDAVTTDETNYFDVYPTQGAQQWEQFSFDSGESLYVWCPESSGTVTYSDVVINEAAI